MEFICIECPNGCLITAENINKIKGASCSRGMAYARAELTNPTRSLTTTVKTVYAEFPVVSVRTDGAIPKGLVDKAMKEINKAVVDKPLGIGDVVISDLLGTGVNVIITSDNLRRI